MNTNTAEQTLTALKQEQAGLPEQLKAAVNAMRSSEVKRIKQRQDELDDEILSAEMDLVNAQLADLPSAQEMARRGRQAQAQLAQAEQEHTAAVEKLIAARTLVNADMVVSISTSQERDRLLRAKAELEIRFAVASGETVYVDMAGNRVKTPGSYPGGATTPHAETAVSPFAGRSEVNRTQPGVQRLRPFSGANT